MSDGKRRTAPSPADDRARRSLPDHPVRVALLDLLAEVGTVTSTQAAARLGHSSGLCSFHLRQLARYGLVEEAPGRDGRARPWRLRWDVPGQPDEDTPGYTPECAPGDTQGNTPDTPGDSPEDAPGNARPGRAGERPTSGRVPAESFGAVLNLTPAEAADLTASIHRLLDDYRDDRPAGPSPGAVSVAAVVGLFPFSTGPR